MADRPEPIDLGKDKNLTSYDGRMILSIVMPRSTYDRLLSLQRLGEHQDYAQAINYALGLYDLVQRNIANGAVLALIHEDGTTQEIRI